MIEPTFWLIGLASLGIFFTKVSTAVECGVWLAVAVLSIGFAELLATLRRMAVVLTTAVVKSAEVLAKSAKEEG